jgi:putative acetyltransferase
VEIQLRRARVEDATTIRNLHVAAIRRTCKPDYTPEQILAWSANRKIDRYRWAMEEGGETMFVAVSQNRIVGFSSCYDDEICSVYVHPNYKGRGIGAILLQAVEDEIRGAGWEEAHLNATLTAVQFYAKYGWENTGGLKEEERNGVGIPCVGMTKRYEKIGSGR